MSETIEGLRNKLLEHKKAFKSKGLIVNLWKINLFFCDGITKDDMSKSNAGPCRV